MFCVALLARLVVLSELSALPLFRTPQLDSREYYEWARILASGTFVWPVAITHGPGYPVFLAVTLYVFGGSLTAARILQSILGAMTCRFVFAIGRKYYGERAGNAAGILLALYGPLILIDVSILGEGLLLCLITAGVYCATRRWPVASGVLLGMAVIVRPTAIVALPVLAVLLWRRQAVMLIATFTVVVLPIVLIHRNESGGLQPIQARAGLNLYQGVSPLRTGTASARLGRGWEQLAHEPARLGLRGAAEDRYYMQKAAREIRQMPMQFAALLVSKAIWLTQNVEIRDSHSFYFFRAQAPLLKIAIPFAVLFGLAVAGMYKAFNKELFALVVLFSLTVVGLMAGYRYRMPVVPFLAIFAGAAIVRIRARDVAAVAVCACALSFVRPHPASHNMAEEWDLTALAQLQENDVAGARRSYERALAEDPRWVRAVGGLATIAVHEQHLDEAARLVDRALKLDRDYADGHYLAGLIAELRGDAAGAAREYGTTVRLQPDRTAALEKYAEASAATGAVAKARAAYARLLALADRRFVVMPDSERTRVYLRIGELYAAEGRFVDAIDAARRAAAIEPGNARAWMLLCMVAIDADRLDIARDAFEQARALTAPNDPNLALVAQRLGSAARG